MAAIRPDSQERSAARGEPGKGAKKVNEDRFIRERLLTDEE